MSRQRPSFSRRDYKRALISTDEAGKPVQGSRFFPDGSFVLLFGEPEPPAAANGVEPNEWDADLYGSDQTEIR